MAIRRHLYAPILTLKSDGGLSIGRRVPNLHEIEMSPNKALYPITHLSSGSRVSETNEDEVFDANLTQHPLHAVQTTTEGLAHFLKWVQIRRAGHRRRKERRKYFMPSVETPPR